MSPDQPDAPLSAQRLRRRATRIALLFVALMAVALGVGAWQLASSQSHQRSQLRRTFANRSVIASGVLGGLFNTAFASERTLTEHQFAGRVDARALAAYAKQNQALYAAVLRPDGSVIAASPGTPAHPAATVVPVALKAPAGLAVGDLTRIGGASAVESVVVFAQGQRLLATGSAASTFVTFLSGALASLVPGQSDEAYILDGRGAVLGAASHDSPKTPPPPSRHLIASAAHGMSGFYDAAGGRRFFVSSPEASTHWHVVVSESTSKLYRSASGASRWLPWVILAVLGGALFLIGFLMRRAIEAGARIAEVNTQLEASQDRLRDRAIELQVANAELQRSNAELEQFAYVASHDLSAPLRAVAGFSQLLGTRYRGTLDADADDFIRHMQDGVERMQRIIDDLLAYSRVDRSGLQAEPIDLDAILDEVLHSLGPDIEERNALVTRDALGRAFGEAGQLSQVLQNLVANGIKFTAPGVRPAVAISARREGDRVRVTVADNGIGIDPEQGDRIFKMFQRLHTDEDYPGTGIGLAIAKKIIDRHGGRIEIGPGIDATGTSFTFDIPAGPGA